jgi:hypothetical protein
MHLTLLSRAYCHLCDEMETALRPLIGATPLAVIDIDAPEHSALEARYGDAVPVLFAGDPAEGRELSRYRLDPVRVLARLAENPEIR